jgi:hypothetical protein
MSRMRVQGFNKVSKSKPSNAEILRRVGGLSSNDLHRDSRGKGGRRSATWNTRCCKLT